MKLSRISLSAALSVAFLAAAASAQPSNVSGPLSGTVNNKTTGKPSAGDTVELVDVQANMSAVAKTTSNASGHYTLNEPGSGPYLIRVTHQGATYFIAAGAPTGGDVSVYDVKAKVDGVSLEADIFEVEANDRQISVTENILIHNTSSPQVTQYSAKGFEVVLPEGAVLDSAEATRPSGLPTMAMPKPTGEKNHYRFDVPIDPDKAEKTTQILVQYHLPYSGKISFHPHNAMAVDNLAVILPKAMGFTPGDGAAFQPVNQDPGVQTFLMRGVPAGKEVAFEVSGTGQMPRDSAQPQGGGDAGAQGGQQSGAAGAGPGGGIGVPINQPDPLSKYKWWILGGVVLGLAVVAAFLLRKPAGTVAATPAQAGPTTGTGAAYAAPTAAPTATSGNAALLNSLKDELFSLESDKISGKIDLAEYDEQKAALETVLKRALQRNS